MTGLHNININFIFAVLVTLCHEPPYYLPLYFTIFGAMLNVSNVSLQYGSRVLFKEDLFLYGL